MNPDLHDWLVERGYDPDEYDPYGFGPVAAIDLFPVINYLIDRIEKLEEKLP